ncbi:DUF1398 domain-containing protein [Runella zeae]|jgi:uncharacterized protein YbcV (DUF1398 family)|uniref:DUF1398 domain-containing protein n=1 Tax=Runella zeae TaxID=94255 RepID=UPI0003FB07B1|nr:DUF1398 family protein [Runella zeae]
MFSIDQIKEAHSKVKSGADFPAYIQEIKALGVTFYETYVSDGHTTYWGINDYQTSTYPKYEPLTVASQTHQESFQMQLKEHQQGKTDYMTFVEMCAQTGIEKWAVCIDKMTCTYFDCTGNAILVEQIPG